MNDITFNILKIVIAVASVLITTYLIPYIKTKTQDARYQKLLHIVEVAVKAAEQTIGGGQGKIKKEEVIAFVTDWMVNHGIMITQEELSQLIEAAVYGMKQEG